MKTKIAAALLVMAAAAARAQAPPTHPVVRLRPAAFRELPKALADELTRRGCAIPQPYTDRRANVIRGEFERPGQIDWAVVCSAKGFSSILVFWNGSERDPAQIARWREPDESVIYDAFIRPVGRKFIMDRYRAYGGPKPPPIDHEGIESGGEKASVVWYLYRGRWLKLQGAD